MVTNYSTTLEVYSLSEGGENSEELTCGLSVKIEASEGMCAESSAEDDLVCSVSIM